MYCSRCGSQQLDNATTCGQCGAPLARPSGPPPLPPRVPLDYQNPYHHQPRDIGQDAAMRLLLPVGRSGWAIAAGYAGLFAIVVLPAPLAVILSIIAMVDMKRHPEKHGMGRAIFGLTTGLLGTAGLIMLIVTKTL
ncbi:MAG: DUF4190 domain-containing protein [Tepidisphaeraceae bacterium]